MIYLLFFFSIFHPPYHVVNFQKIRKRWTVAAIVAPLYAQHQRSFVPRERAAIERNSGNDKMAGRSKLSSRWPTWKQSVKCKYLYLHCCQNLLGLRPPHSDRRAAGEPPGTMNQGRRRFGPQPGLMGSPPRQQTKPNRLSRSYRPSQQTQTAGTAESPKSQQFGE